METVPARVLELFRGERTLHLVLDAGEGPLRVDIDLTPRTLAALPLVFALLGHQRGCQGGVDFAAGLVLRVAAQLGGEAACLVVRPGRPPAFWLRLLTADGPVAVDVDVLDAFALLLSRRLPVAVTAPQPLAAPADHDWDAALTRLLDEG